jgi:hypothetical protein
MLTAFALGDTAELATAPPERSVRGSSDSSLNETARRRTSTACRLSDSLPLRLRFFRLLDFDGFIAMPFPIWCELSVMFVAEFRQRQDR